MLVDALRLTRPNPQKPESLKENQLKNQRSLTKYCCRSPPVWRKSMWMKLRRNIQKRNFKPHQSGVPIRCQVTSSPTLFLPVSFSTELNFHPTSSRVTIQFVTLNSDYPIEPSTVLTPTLPIVLTIETCLQDQRGSLRWKGLIAHQVSHSCSKTHKHKGPKFVGGRGEVNIAPDSLGRRPMTPCPNLPHRYSHIDSRGNPSTS